MGQNSSVARESYSGCRTRLRTEADLSDTQPEARLPLQTRFEAWRT